MDEVASGENGLSEKEEIKGRKADRERMIKDVVEGETQMFVEKTTERCMQIETYRARKTQKQIDK